MNANQAHQERLKPIQYLRINEVAALLTISRSKVYQLIEAGSLRSVRMGRSRRVSTEALAEYQLTLEA